MGDIVSTRNIGSLGLMKRLSAAASATAAGAGDSTTTTGVTIDRAAFVNSMPVSMAAMVAWEATLATSKTLSIGYAVQTSDDNSSWTDYQTATYAVVATGSTAASALAGEFTVNVNLTSARRYVRMNFAVDLSATQTDTCVARAVGFVGGFGRHIAA